MAEDPTATTADAAAAPAPVAEVPPAVETVPELTDVPVEAAAAVSAASGSVESVEESSATAMEVDEAATASAEEKSEVQADSSDAREAGEIAEVAVVAEEKDGSSETATAEEDAGEQVGVVDGDVGVGAGEGEAATEQSDPVPSENSAVNDEPAMKEQGETKQEEATNGEETPAEIIPDSTKEEDNEQTATEEKETTNGGAADVEMSAVEDAVDVDMAVVEGAAGDKEAPAASAASAAAEAIEDHKEVESDAKPVEEVAVSESSDAAKPVDDTPPSDSVDSVKPEKEEAPEVSTKRKEREESATTVEAVSNPEAPEPALKEGESSTKKQKVETPNERNVSSDSSAPAAPEANAEAADAADVTPMAAAPIMISRDDMAKMEEDDGVLRFDVISNDGAPEHMVQLTTLKNIFAKQLPKMPKEYIVRLVFDRNHRSMIILKNGKHVIGGICYRPFEPNQFAEIAFCAINASDQVKGYGTRLMNHLKEFVKRQGISHFLTYADNYAIGYFKKQGFSKVVSMPRPNWFGYIKDYDGGTLMECTIHHQINYLRITSMVQKQRQAILDKIKQNSKAHIVYPGLTKFAEGRLLDIYMVPGVKEAGWSQATIRNNRIGTRDPGSLKTQLTQQWKAVASHRSAWPFHEPVDTNVVVDYLEYIKEPIDLTTIGKRVEAGAYVTKAQFKADLDKMCVNCMVYNLPDTNYYKAAMDLQEFINKRVQVRDQPR